MKNGFFWDITPCGSYKNRCFEGTESLLHQGDKNRKTRNNVRCDSDEGGSKFLRNFGSYKSHTA
jgi:hypothetical protein